MRRLRNLDTETIARIWWSAVILVACVALVLCVLAGDFNGSLDQ